MPLKEQLLQLTQMINAADADDDFALTVLSSKLLARMAELGLVEGVQKTTDAALKAERQAIAAQLEQTKRDAYLAGKGVSSARTDAALDSQEPDRSDFESANI